MKDIKKIIMRDRFNSKVFSPGIEVYIVGGYLRDVMAGRESKDTDYIVRGDINKFAHQLLVQKVLNGATIVELKKEQMIRIVLKNNATLDFTELKGRLEDNLSARDFTINALAWSPQTGLIDLYGGVRDIRKKTIRAISIDNFKNDPLRLLRVYRFISELNWGTDSKTQQMVKLLKREIKKSASERITTEFFKLLNSKNYERALKMALKNSLLECFLEIPQKKLEENINALSKLEAALKNLPKKYRINLENPFSQELTLHGLLRLEGVLYGSSLNRNSLRLSRIIYERLKMVHGLLTSDFSLLTSSKMFDTFFKARDAAFDFLILSGNIKLLSQLERFKKIWKKSFLTAAGIMDITGLKGSIELGKLIYRLKRMEFEGKLNTKKETIKWLLKNDNS